MIGKYARGFRHLMRSVEASKVKKVFILQNGRVLKCDAIVSKINGQSKKAIVLFQNLGGDRDLYKFPTENRTIAEKLLTEYNSYFCAFSVQHLRQLGTKVLIVDDDFNEQYDSFKSSNKKLLDQVYGKYCYPTDAMAYFMFALTGNTPNLYVWGLTNYYKNHITINTIEHIIRWSKNYNQLVGKLSKGTITAYNSKEKVNELIGEIVKLRSNKRANDAINSFNTAQKKLLKKVELNDKNTKILNKFGRLSNIKKHNFIRKMSTIENVDDILHQMALLSNIHFEWNRDSFMDYVKNAENINCEIIIDENNIVLVKVKTYDTIKLLAKTTNWCISKNKKYWNDYVEFRDKSNQFVLFDFNKPEDHEFSIVGFTTSNNNCITNAHSYSNNNLMGASRDYGQLTSYLEQTKQNIYDVLKSTSVPLSKILEFKTNRYKWNYKSFLTFLNYCIKEEEYNIHFMDMEDNRIVLSTSSPNVRFLIGDGFRNFTQHSFREVFMFVDFNYDEDESYRIKFGLVYHNNHEKEDFCDNIYDAMGSIITNETFDSLLENYGLPYDTICRTDDTFKRFSYAFRNHDIASLNKLINDETVINRLSKKDNDVVMFRQTAYNAIYDSIFNCRSFDYINLIYNNNRTLYDILGTKLLDDIITSVVYDVANQYRIIGDINEEVLNKFYTTNTLNSRQRMVVGSFIVLDKIFSHENHKNFGKKLIDVFHGINHYRNFDIYLLNIILNKLSFKSSNSTNDFYIRHIASMYDNELDAKMFDLIQCDDCGRLYLSYMNSSSPIYDEFKTRYNKEKEVDESSNNETPKHYFTFANTSTTTTNGNWTWTFVDE